MGKLSQLLADTEKSLQDTKKLVLEFIEAKKKFEEAAGQSQDAREKVDLRLKALGLVGSQTDAREALIKSDGQLKTLEDNYAKKMTDAEKLQMQMINARKKYRASGKPLSQAFDDLTKYLAEKEKKKWPWQSVKTIPKVKAFIKENQDLVDSLR